MNIDLAIKFFKKNNDIKKTTTSSALFFMLISEMFLVLSTSLNNMKINLFNDIMIYADEKAIESYKQLIEEFSTL